MELKDWMPLITSGLGATVFGFFGAYVAVMGRNLATKRDTDFLRHELAQNTTVTKSIEQNLSETFFLRRRELEFRAAQLAELYGPVYGYLKSQQILYELWTARQLDEKNMEIKQLFARQNAIIRDLIITKTHLIDGAEVPPSFVTFFASTIIFDLYAASSQEGQVPEHLRQYLLVKYPRSFDNHIRETTEKLKGRIQELNAEYAIPLSTKS